MIHHWDPPVSMTEIYQDPPSEPTGSVQRIHQDPLHGIIKITNQDPPGPTTGIHLDPPMVSTRIYKQDSQGSTIWLNNFFLIHQ